MALLELRDLSVNFAMPGQTVAAVKGVSFALDKRRDPGAGRRIGLGQVGDRAVDPAAAALSAGEPRDGQQHRVRRPGTDRRQARRLLQRIRGDRIAMVFQEPMTSLNPLHTIEKQIAETLFLHKGLRGRGGARADGRTAAAGRAAPRPKAGSTPIRTSFRAGSASA